MAVVFVKAQLRIRAGSPEMTGMILPVVMPPAADTREMSIAVPDEFVKSLLRLFDEIAERLNCLSPFRLACPLLFLLFALALLFSTHSISLVLCSLLFAYSAGTYVAADNLPITNRVEPLPAVDAFSTRFFSHTHPAKFISCAAAFSASR